MDLIATSSVHDLVPTYPRPTLTLPSLIEDFAPLDDEPFEVPLPPMVSSLPSSSSLSPRANVSKKRKRGEDPTPQIQAIDLEDFEFDEVIMRDAIEQNTSMTYFDEGMFR